jgi:peroxiredoxin Q/BCP
MVELRKRKAPPPPPVTRQAKKKNTGESTAKSAVLKKVAKVKEVVKKAISAKKDEAAPATEEAPVPAPIEEQKKEDIATAPEPAPKASGPPKVGDVVNLESFGGEVETHDGKKVTLKQLVDESKAGVVLFTYPKANTPGCTKQACAFRDGHETLTSGGLAIYGLSGDSPKSNTTFKTKQNLPYTLLCNPSYSLIGAIGMQGGVAHKTNRGVFAVDKSGKVLLNFLGGPIPTVDEVKKLVDEMDKK